MFIFLDFVLSLQYLFVPDDTLVLSILLLLANITANCTYCLFNSFSPKLIRLLYSRMALSLHVQRRYFNEQETRPDFHLCRNGLWVLLDALYQERRQVCFFSGWWVKHLSRMVSCGLEILCSTVHHTAHSHQGV